MPLIAEKWGQDISLLGISVQIARLAQISSGTSGRLERTAASPGAALSLVRMNADIDVRHLLPSVTVPTLVLHRVGDPMIAVEHGRELSARISV